MSSANMMSSASGQEPRLYLWDFDGHCSPASGGRGYTTFSVGIFQWVPKTGGRGLKRGKVVERVRGSWRDAEAVYEQARVRCNMRNEQREGYPADWTPAPGDR